MTQVKPEIVRFVRCLYSRGDIVEWRAINGSRVESGWVNAEDTPKQVDMWLKHNTAGLNVYVGANPRIEKGKRTDANVALCRTVFVDFDGLDSSDGASYDELACSAIEDAGLPTPTMRVFSGHGIHAYWRLLVALKPEEWVHAQECLIATLGTDRVIKNPERIMRVPGFENCKAEPRIPCFIIEADHNRVCDISDVLSHCKTPEAVKPVESRPLLKSPLLEAKARAMLYAAKWPACSEGERNNSAYLHACTLSNDFSLPDSDVLEILRQWNSCNTPPLPDEEVLQAFGSAKKGAKHPPGCKLTERPQKREHSEPVVAEPAGTGVQIVGKVIEDTISGKRRAVEWPWHLLGDYTEALVNGTVTALCGSKGATKTFFVLQSMDHWLEQGERVAMLVMEEDAEHCLRRCLAQRSGYAGITQSKWVKEHPGEARQALKDHASVMNRMSKHLYDLPDRDITLPEIAEWISGRVKDGYRIIVVDPITAAVQTKDPWIQDASFINGVKRIAREAGISVILTTHPKKGGSHTPDMDSLAGSAAWVRFAQTILWLEAHDEKSVVIQSCMGKCEMKINRTMHILAARNAAGRNKRIGYTFSGESLTFSEVGVVIKEPKNNEYGS